MVLQTEYEFTLPKGYVDDAGTLHKNGIMRLATAGDEILPMKDPKVQANPAYLTIILFARVITKLGEVESINPKVIENLFAADLAYLQALYNRINGNGTQAMKAVCPQCGQQFEVEPETVGES